MWFSNRDRNTGLSFSNFSWQSEKISAKESCLYGIIDVRITPFLDVWFIVSRQLYYTISGEGLFCRTDIRNRGNAGTGSEVDRRRAGYYLKNSRLMQEINHRFVKRVVPKFVYHPFLSTRIKVIFGESFMFYVFYSAL